MKKVFYLMFLIFLSNIFIYGLGTTEESDYREVSGKDNWEYEVPLQEKEPGEYNLLIRVKDKADNETLTGPFNIIIDPESDLPLVSITNPTRFMRVGGKLNIVGTARDDDAVAKVLLKINDSDWVEAEGQEFWSYNLDSNKYQDGVISITGKAIDINGKEGYETSVLYNQDTLKPLNNIENFKNGALFSGKVEIKGTIIDANEIESLQLSTDNQENYVDHKFNKNKDEDFYTFSSIVDTKKLADGANIYWYKSKDKTGSITITPFLFFVDNIGPEITIIDPVDLELNGTITISGKITDSVGINSFKYIYGEEEKIIELKKGNPYWSENIDLINETKDKVKILFVSEDKSGNITQYEHIQIINKEIDKPKLALRTPVNESIYKKDLIIEGSVLDDDYIKGIEYSIDNQDFVLIETFNAFTAKVENLETGLHKFRIRPIDSDNIIGDEIKLEFQIDSGAPVIELSSVFQEEKTLNYVPGMEFLSDGNSILSGKIISGNTLVGLQLVLEGFDPIDITYKKVDEDYIYNISVDKKFPYGKTDFKIIARDNYNNETEFNSTILLKDYTKINDDWGIYYSSYIDNDLIPLKDGNPFEIYFNGPEIKSVTSEPASEIFKVSRENNSVIVSKGKEGISENIKFVIDTDKGQFQTEEFNFISDSTNPIIDIITPLIDSSQSGVMQLEAEISDSFLELVEYKLSNESEYKELKHSNGIIKTTITISPTEFESLTLEIKATDKLGNFSRAYRTFLVNENKYALSPDGKINETPTIFINNPLTGSVYFTEPYLSGYTRDDDSIKEIIITENIEGGKVQQFPIKGAFDISLKSFGTGKKSLTINSINQAGVSSKLVKLSYIYEPDRAKIKLENRAGALMGYSTNNLIKGTILTNLSGTLEYCFADEVFKKAAIIDGKFEIPVAKNLNWGRNPVQLKYTDEFGRIETQSSFFYLIDSEYSGKVINNPGIYINYNQVVDGKVDLSNESFKGFFIGREIKKIELVSSDGEIPGFLELNNRSNIFEVKSLKSGLSKDIKVVIETIDGDIYESSNYIFISDNFKPELNITSENNQFVQDKFILTGTVKDELKLSEIKYSLNQGLSWISVPMLEMEKLVETEQYTSTFPTDNIPIKKIEPKEFQFNESIDLLNLPDGGYTLWVSLTDAKGNETIKNLSFVKDNTNPVISMFIPGIDEINGVMSIIGKSNDNIELEKVVYSIDGIDFTDITTEKVYNFSIDFGLYDIFPETFVIRAIDKAGNYTDIFPILNINQEGDKPRVEIQTPAPGEIIRNNFIISGMAFDDDEVQGIYYSLDGGEFILVAEKENNFSIDVPLESVLDNEHTIQIKAVDILGKESDTVVSNFWISREEPTSELLLPSIESTKSGTIKLIGKSFDENSIDSIYISTDNGVSYQLAEGREEWNYTFNSTNIKDGTYSLFVKAIDKLQTEGFYSTLINIDNTSPELIINEPFDGDILSDKIIFSGRSMDNIGLEDVAYKIYTHSEIEGTPILVEEGKLENSGIFNIAIPLQGYEPGEYNIELIAFDKAGNRAISTRNFTVTPSENAGEIELLYPQPGSLQTSVFEVSGRLSGRKKAKYVECYIDGVYFSDILVNSFNYFNLKVDTLNLTNGEHIVKAFAILEDGEIYESSTNNFIVNNSGAWLSIINMKTGDNISGRPFLTGEAGYISESADPEDTPIVPQLVEVSLDNGQIFLPAEGSSKWQFRVETWQYVDGITPILVRALYSDGSIKTSRITVNIDRTLPEVSLLNEVENGRYNDNLKLSGTAFDSNGLKDISVILREGNKSKYEVPGIFQGMFIDLETGYGKLYGAGIGLTFFDDNVKLQFTFGQTRTASVDARIKGNYYGGKLIANLYTLEFGSLFGPDLDPYSISLGVGASFTNKTLSVSDEESVMWYSAIIGQLDLIKIKFDNRYLSSVELFMDFEATLISSEKSGGFYPRLGIGSRITLF
ncbi:MAG: hypothetical protein JXR64_12125 [Spirochaetales bacterium]|nr:hypothetical protein [Spirochaetales bacterium]